MPRLGPSDFDSVSFNGAGRTATTDSQRRLGVSLFPARKLPVKAGGYLRKQR